MHPLLEIEIQGKMRRILLALSLLLLVGCQQEPPKSPYVVDTPSGEVDTRVSTNGKTRPTLAETTTWDEVEYYNPNTGTHSTYTCEIDRGPDGEIQRINWPSSGWLEVDGDTVDNGDGTETFTADNGYEYTIHGGGEPSEGTSDEPEEKAEEN